jgi:hypothetical protein
MIFDKFSNMREVVLWSLESLKLESERQGEEGDEYFNFCGRNEILLMLKILSKLRCIISV